MITGLTIVAILTSAVLSYFVIPPLYETKAVLMVTQQRDEKAPAGNREQDIQDVINTVSRLPLMTVNTYVAQLTTPALLQRVINKLGLDPQSYTPAGLANLITVKAIKDTNLIEIYVRNTDPQLAARIANTLRDEFLQFITENNQQQMAKAVEFLQQQKQKVDADLAKAAAALKEFNAKPNGVELLEKQNAKRMEDLALYQSQLQLAGVETEQLRAAKASLEARLAQTPPKVTVKQPLLTAGKEEVAAGPVGEVETVNPVYTRLQEDIAAKDAALADKEAQISGLKQVIAQLQKDLEGLQADLTAKKTEQDRLQRQVKQLEEASSLLAQKITETSIASSINLGGTALVPVGAAMVPTAPVKPNKRLNMAVAGVLGLMIAVFLAFLLEYLDNTVKDPEQLESLLGLPVLGTVPQMTRKRRR
ncbi:hypothetical protein MGLY_20340 [Neomoorella glycerini]|uniref:Tyrosine-protein kinase G-rich domain-containing protein n=1 Tax=Neomoorella glycerini TaxID=55779 RepID=A0A6I5ZSD6_9FIRM|nr:GNVR domain-containing protein [Moorella glycerini]QGP92646.1 hypothetical protein MGLY_20340 [Moorella glycerini]